MKRQHDNQWIAIVALAGLWATTGRGAATKDAVTNLALFATPATSYVSGHESLDAINDGFEPRGVGDHSHGAYGNWPRTGTQWVELNWSQPISTQKIDEGTT